jgi:hypothetical protein
MRNLVYRTLNGVRFCLNVTRHSDILTDTKLFNNDGYPKVKVSLSEKYACVGELHKLLTRGKNRPLESANHLGKKSTYVYRPIDEEYDEMMGVKRPRDYTNSSGDDWAHESPNKRGKSATTSASSKYV